MSAESKFVGMLSMLLKRGYGIIKGKDYGLSDRGMQDLAAMGRSAPHAPVDPNCASQTRRRRFEQAFCVPGQSQVLFFPRCGNQDLESVQVYQQSSAYNPAEDGKERPFASFTEIQRTLPGLHELFQLDAAIARAVLREPDAILEMHAHEICYVPREGVPSVSSPPYVHCDSEPITFAHILERVDVTGGFNAVTTVKARNLPFADVEKHNVLATFTLSELLDTFIVVDDMVAHYVSPVEASGPNPRRAILLVDFTPLRPVKKED